MNCNAMWEKVYNKKVQMLNILGYAKVTLRCGHTYYTVQGPFKGFTFFSVAVRTTDYNSLAKRFFSREERIQWDYSLETICISNKQFLTKNFAAAE